MKSKVKRLHLIVSSTLILLAIGAVLVVLGLFNEALHWDLFGPKLEAFLYGLFGSCMALAGFGLAMAVLIALQESVLDFKKFVHARIHLQDAPDAPRRAYAARGLAGVVVLGLLVGLCALANHRVLMQRCDVFKRLAAEQAGYFKDRITGIVETFDSPPGSDVPRDLYDVVKTLDGLEFITTTTLYIPDPTERAVLWGFTAWRESYTNCDGFARFYVVKDFEKAMRKAVDGTPADLDRINALDRFTWYTLLSGSNGQARAVLRIDGDSRHSFRDYRLGQ